jgi:cation diffusion facilitator family transporter
MDKKSAGYLEGFISISTNLVLFVLKIWAGVVSNSVALIADAWHSLSDSLSSIVVIIGSKLAAKKPDKEHPFGHGRWELIAAILIGFILAVIAYDILVDSIQKLTDQKSADFGIVAIVVIIASIVINEGLTQYAFYLGRKTDSMTVKADAWHHRTDAISSVVVLIGIFLNNYFWWIDSILGIIIALMIFYVVYDIIMKAANKLLGEKPSAELIEKIESIISDHSSSDIQPHHYHFHNYVNHKELTFHIKLDQKMYIMEGHALATKIEDSIFDKFNIHTTIHIEPLSVKHRFD